MADSPATFKASVRCETLKGYDPNYASHGDNYGQHLGKDATVPGFYQLAERGGKLYAAFAGASRRSGQHAMPGMLVVLDAKTLRHERSVALPFQAHALTLSPAGVAEPRYAIATHSYINAFSIIDLATGAVRCLKPDTSLGDVKEYRGRYVAADEEGNFYISYYSTKDQKAKSVVMKYDASGEHAADFAINVFESGMALPLLYRDGELVVGANGPKAVSARTGAVRVLATAQDGLEIYNYVRGPGGTLLGGNRSPGVVKPGLGIGPNLVLFDVGSNSRSAIYTGFSSVEVGYVEEAGQAFSANLQAKTLTVAALPSNARGFVQSRFINIPFEGSPTNLLARRVAGGTEVFVTLKFPDDPAKAGQLHKVSIDAAVQGIDGISASGACTVTTFDLSDKSVSNPVACTIRDARASYRADANVAQRDYLTEYALEQQQEIRGQLAEAQAAWEAARQSGADASALAKAKQKLEALWERESWIEQYIVALRAGIELLERLGKND